MKLVSTLVLSLAAATAAARPGFDEDAAQVSSILESREVRTHAHGEAMPQWGTPTELKIMQFNCLADGLAKDGFLSPRPFDTQASFFARIQDVANVVKGMNEIELDKKEKDKDRPDKYYTQETGTASLAVNPLPVANLLHPSEVALEKDLTAQRMDWERRIHQVTELVRKADPDVLTLQEVDHYEDLAALLALWGYTSQREKRSEDPDYKDYAALKKDRLDKMDKEVKQWKKAEKELGKKVDKAKEEVEQALRDEEVAGNLFKGASEKLQELLKEDEYAIYAETQAQKKMVEDYGEALEGQKKVVEEAQHMLEGLEREVVDLPLRSSEAINAEYDKHLALLSKNGVAFAPMGNSNARKVWIRSNKGRATPAENMEKDDEGSAIFWKTSKFKLADRTDKDEDDAVVVVRLAVNRPFDPRSGVRVILQALDDPAKLVAVMTTHIASSPEKELLRHFELRSMYFSLMQPMEKEKLPVIFSADLNSDINFDMDHPKLLTKPVHDELQTSVFEMLGGDGTVDEREPLDKDLKVFSEATVEIPFWRMQSVYNLPKDDPKPSATDRRPVTVVKMRGTGTDQPHKMGDFQLETIDHIFYRCPGSKALHLQGTPTTLGPALPDMTALQMRAFRDLIDEGSSMGSEVPVADGTLYWRRDLTPTLLGLHDSDFPLTDDDWEIKRITQHMLPSFEHPSDHFALISTFALYRLYNEY